MSTVLEGSTPPSRRISRHHTLYFPDGNVVLAADDAMSGRHLFRVHSATLSLHATIFADMFTLPLVPTSNEEYDGVPLICLVGDDVEAVTALLNYMYNPVSLALGERSSEKQMLYLKLLDIATKYQVDSVKPMIISRLIADWPPTLFKWLQMQGEVSTVIQVFAHYWSDITPGEPLDSMFPEPAAAIRMALDHNIPSILPAAFYALAQIEFKNDWDRWRDFEWPYEQDRCDDDNPLFSDDERTARWSLIDRESLYRLCLGKATLADRKARMWKIFVDEEQPSHCTDAEACKPERRRLQRRYSTMTGPWWKFGRSDPLCELKEWLTGTHDIHLCRNCGAGVESKIKEKMEELWEELPIIFHLDSISSVSH